MKSSEQLTNKQVEQGRAIARGMDEIQTQKQNNMARAEKRIKSTIRNAANKEMFQ